MGSLVLLPTCLNDWSILALYQMGPLTGCGKRSILCVRVGSLCHSCRLSVVLKFWLIGIGFIFVNGAFVRRRHVVWHFPGWKRTHQSLLETFFSITKTRVLFCIFTVCGVKKKKCLLALAASCEKGINKQGCPLLERSGYDVFVFSMIACQQIKHYEPGLQQRRACSEDREGTVSQTLSWRFLFNAIRFPLSFFSASVSFFNYFFVFFFFLTLSLGCLVFPWKLDVKVIV